MKNMAERITKILTSYIQHTDIQLWQSFMIGNDPYQYKVSGSCQHLGEVLFLTY